jgi:hypothetical protein
MPRMLDMIKASSVPANLMHAAANGALSVPAIEVLEILVYLTHNPVFGEQARLTLAGWDEKASREAVRDPNTPREILDYFIAPQNLRPGLLPALLENPAIQESVLIQLAGEGPRDAVSALLGSTRARESQKILHALCVNVHLTISETEQVNRWLSGLELRVVGGREAGGSDFSAGEIVDDANADETAEITPDVAEALKDFELEHAAELATVEEAPFRALGGTYGLDTGEGEAELEEAETEAAAVAEAPPAAVASAARSGAAAAAPAKKKLPPVAAPRVSVLQKISRLDVKGRVNLAVRGSKEERAILVRDGTKLVALAVLQSPKISDGEVEKFAAQKNVLEATLRGITMHRRFMKNYVIVRNLTCNPRTPLDLSLGLVKNLLTQDLKNLSGNKEVSETLRKMALRALKQKVVAPK